MLVPCLTALATFVPVGDRITGRDFATRSEVIAKHGMAATSQPLATQAALRILQQGGSAADAAIAANAVLALVEPVGCGLGGDLFAIVWDAKTRKLHGLNASGRSPLSLKLEEFEKRGLARIPSFGPLPVSVPGCVDGWCELSKRFGRLPLEKVLAPAVQYAREGAPISELIAYYWKRNAAALEKYENFAATFMPGGSAPGIGVPFANPALASTLEKIGKGGRTAFYEGEIARTIESYMKRNGGFLTAADLAAHRSDWVDPVSTSYRGYDVWELPPNGQGIAALQILNVLEGYDLKAMGFGSPDHVHLFVEAKKLAFEDRARWYADPAFGKIPVSELISKEYAAERRKLIDMTRAARSYPVGNPALEHGDTIYLTTADEEGNMVSLIQSNYRGMGSGMTPDGLGFVLQDRGELFDLAPGRLNTYAPGKRPFHTIIPAFVTKGGEPFLSFGVMGGATQPQGHVQILVNMIDFGMNSQEAGDAPRILHEGSSEPTGEEMTDGGKVSLESGFPARTKAELAKRGHQFVPGTGNFGGYQAIRWDPVHRVYYGASESRKDGQAAGY
jgi:gamma-glutamyltranspeptidase/glutathione hydrolase